MGQLGIFTRTAVVAGLVGIAASTLTTQDASAFGFGGGFRGFGGGGGARIGGGFHGFGGGFHPVLDRRGPIGRPLPIRLPDPRLPPTGFRPGRPGLFPPIVRHPWPRWPIGWHPWPRLPPIVRVPPPHILPPPVIVGGPRLPIVPVATAGAAAVGIGAVQPTAPVVAACATGGTFVAITFVPTVSAADITNFLTSYNVTMADGPNTNGVYRIRLSDGSLPPNEIASLIASMRNETGIVASVAGA